MVWLVGIIGFICGFALGQVLLMRWLKDKPRTELLHNKDLHYKYGLMNWGFALLGCVSFLIIYNYYS